MGKPAGAATLNNAYGEIIAAFLSEAKEQTEFDKDIFKRLIAAVRIKSRSEIIFEFKDGTEVKADTDGIEA